MKKEIIICDKCKKEFEAKQSVYASIFINENGLVNGRCDVCGDCLNEFLQSSEKAVMTDG